MKKQALLFLTSVVLVGSLAVCSQAQSRSRQELRVNVPFAFNVGGESLPAGEYRVSVVNPASDRSVLQIAGVTGHSNIMVLTNDIKGRSKNNALITFRQYGNKYFLAQVWMAADPMGLSTTQSRFEKQVQRQLGNGHKNYDTVALNAY